jgi:DNA-binding PadR family transcriptional regulator
VLAALSQLDEEQYGYSLINSLKEAGLEIDQGTLYPLLRRLEGQGLLQSAWRIEDGRPRRYYRIAPAGGRFRDELVAEWKLLATVMNGLIR